MGSHFARRAVLVTAVAAVALVGGTALAAQGGTRIVIKGSASFQPNTYYKETLRFAPGTVTVRSGATVTLANTTSDPHTLSIVKHSQEPKTIAALQRCAVCETIAVAHGLNPQAPPSGPPPTPLVNVGAAGFNQPGDSVIIGPKGSPRSTVTFKVTAKPGTTLNFMCAIHPWMQARFIVVK